MEVNSTQKTHHSMNRLLSLDILRGIAIIVMLFLHNASFHYAGLNEMLELDPQPLFVTLMGFILLWAGIFGFISGFANGYINTIRLNKFYANNPDEKMKNKTHNSITKGAIISFIIVFILHWIWTLGTGNSIVTEDPNDPNLRVSLLIGLIYYGEFKPIHPEIFLFASSLWMIAINILIVVLSINWLYKKHGSENPKKKYKKLMIAAIIILIITPVARHLLFRPMMHLVHQGSAGIIAAIPIALLVSDPNPLLPFAAYGLFGAVIAMGLANDEPKKKIKGKLAKFGLLWFILGILGLVYAGGVQITGRSEIWGQDAFYYTSLSYLLLGLFSFFMIIILNLFEFSNEKQQKRRKKLFDPIIRFGRISLTVFIYEGILAYAIRRLIEVFWPTWNESMIVVFIFAAFLVVLWYIIIRLWEKIDFKGSLEWIIARLKRKSK